jgi:hypothetical protein
MGDAIQVGIEEWAGISELGLLVLNEMRDVCWWGERERTRKKKKRRKRNLIVTRQEERSEYIGVHPRHEKKLKIKQNKIHKFDLISNSSSYFPRPLCYLIQTRSIINPSTTVTSNSFEKHPPSRLEKWSYGLLASSFEPHR